MRPSPTRGSSSSACRYPLPYHKIAELYERVSRVVVVEELDPFIEEHVRMLGLPVIGKEAIPADGELDRTWSSRRSSRTSRPRRRSAGARCSRRRRG